MTLSRATTAIALFGTLIAACSSDDTTPAVPAGSGGSNGMGGNAGAGISGASGNSSGTGGGDAMTPGDSTTDSACVRNARVVGGGCQCFSYVPTMCPTACVDTKTDPNACGMWDKKCEPGAGCNAGACGPTPVTPLSSAAGCGPIHLFVVG